jgi:pyrroline-5-carboxylate reductase
VAETDFSGTTLALLGAGQMAEALLRGVLKAKLLPPSRIVACDVVAARRELFSKQMGVRTVGTPRTAAEMADLLILCVKPQQADSVLAEIAPVFKVAKHLLASIAAGVTTAHMEHYLPIGARVVRAMPNTPMLVGLGATCLSTGRHAHQDDLTRLEALFGSAGLVMRVDEKMMDAVTGLSGSGPAYLYYLVEAMADAGEAEGLSRDEALKLAARTCLGAAKMLEETGLPPEELRRRVTSPNGTTQAAIARLDKDEVKKKLVAAVKKAADRSRELGKASRATSIEPSGR